MDSEDEQGICYDKSGQQRMTGSVVPRLMLA
jgi:hypothetical protein